MSDADLTNGQANNGTDAPEQAGEISAPAPADAEIFAARVSELEQLCAQLKDQFLRKAAEFENYKRRTENDFIAITRFAAENTLVQLLPVLDDLQRLLKNRSGASGDDPFLKGVELISAKFLKALETQGLRAMEVMGKEFDVAYHDALMMIPRGDVPPHTIVEEVDRGYMLHDKVIRHARVIVSTSPDDTALPSSQTGEEH